MRKKDKYIVLPSLSMSFNPSAWAGHGEVTCLNYALNAPEIGERNLGDAKKPYFDHTYTHLNLLDAAYLHELAIRDGFVPAREMDPAKTHTVALFGSILRVPKKGVYGDFHFYRQDADNTWSEKNGIQGELRGGIPNEKGMLEQSYRAALARRGEVIGVSFGGYFHVPAAGMTFLKR